MYINMLRFFCNGINITYYGIFLICWGQYLCIIKILLVRKDIILCATGLRHYNLILYNTLINIHII